MEVQHTIARSSSISGRGLFGGVPVTVRFKPAPDGHGIVFVRTDLADAAIPAHVQHVINRPRRTSLKCGEAMVETCEHCLSALAGLSIDNVVVELDAPELPGLDGSARPYLDVLTEAGVQASNAPRRRLKVAEPVVVCDGDSTLAAVPSDDAGMHIVFELDYGPSRPDLRHVRAFDCSNRIYRDQIAPARTFLLESEGIALQAAGVGTHLTPADVLVLGDDGPLGGNALRFDDEPVRHKILDLIGDLYLLGVPIQGRLVAYKSSHPLNHRMARELLKQYEHVTRHELALHRSVLDIRRLKRIMPHRYPMLLVDRVLEIDSNRRIRGIKNVTINEPFFDGHYPNAPIMPGVLIVEAMAQLSGVLIGQTMEHTGKLPIMLSLDKVRLRKPVTPGDQLLMEAEAVRIRSRIAHMRCRAFVAEDLAAEAEVKFMLVDDDQE